MQIDSPNIINGITVTGSAFFSSSLSIIGNETTSFANIDVTIDSIYNFNNKFRFIQPRYSSSLFVESFTSGSWNIVGEFF